MSAPKLSVIIPSRNVPSWPFLKKTIDNLFENATNEIEVIVILDGFIPNPPIQERKNLILIPQKESIGMRQAINLGVSIAKGKFVMKSDDHCAFSTGYDEILINNCEDNWLVVPSRYSLDGDKWLAGETDFKKMTKYGPIDYMYLTPPFLKDDQFGWGFHGKKWYGDHGTTGGYFDREKKYKEIKIDDILTIQGSCWFMSKVHFDHIEGMQVEGYGNFAQESQEICFKTWLIGGRCVVNKYASYAHLHKGPNNGGRGYHLLRHQIMQSQIYSAKHWLGNEWHLAVGKLKWLIEKDKWWPLETWPEDWDNPEFIKNYDYNLWLKK